MDSGHVVADRKNASIAKCRKALSLSIALASDLTSNKLTGYTCRRSSLLSNQSFDTTGSFMLYTGQVEIKECHVRHTVSACDE